jgi:hypothetical protein
MAVSGTLDITDFGSVVNPMHLRRDRAILALDIARKRRRSHHRDS